MVITVEKFINGYRKYKNFINLALILCFCYLLQKIFLIVINTPSIAKTSHSRYLYYIFSYLKVDIGTFISPLVHFDSYHLLANIFTLFAVEYTYYSEFFSNFIEKLNIYYYVGIFYFSSIIVNLLNIIMEPTNASIGSSSGVAGLIGVLAASAIAESRTRKKKRVEAIMFFLVWFIIIIAFHSGEGVRIGWICHFEGFLLGSGLYLIYLNADRKIHKKSNINK